MGLTRKCVACKKDKPLFEAFKPRWRGCAEHADPRTQRRTFVEGCPDCLKVTMSRTRQPRCVDCDAKRKKRNRTVTVAAPPSAAACPFACPRGRHPRALMDMRCAACKKTLPEHQPAAWARVLRGA